MIGLLLSEIIERRFYTLYCEGYFMCDLNRDLSKLDRDICLDLHK
jgi:hypothetical protein